MASLLLVAQACQDYGSDVDTLKDEMSTIKMNEITSLNSQLRILNATAEMINGNVATLSSKQDAFNEEKNDIDRMGTDLRDAINKTRKALDKYKSVTNTDAGSALSAASADIAGAMAAINEAVGSLEDKYSLNDNYSSLVVAAESVNSGIASIQDLTDRTSPQLLQLVSKVEENLIKYYAGYKGEMYALESRLNIAIAGRSNADSDARRILDDNVKNLNSAIESNSNDISVLRYEYARTVSALQRAFNDFAKAASVTDQTNATKVNDALAVIKATAADEDPFLLDMFELAYAAAAAEVSATVSIANCNAQINIYDAELDDISDKTTPFAIKLLDERKSRTDAVERLQAQLEALTLSFYSYVEKALEPLNMTGGASGNGADLSGDISALDGRISELDGKISALSEKEANDLSSALGAVQEYVEELKASIASVQGELGNRLELDEASIRNLWARIQSVNYVPDYSDGKANLSVVINNGHPYVGTATFKYHVKPENQAALLVAAYNSDPSCMDFEVAEVKTRASNASLAITDVELLDAAKGIIQVSALPSNFDDIMLDAGKNGSRYSASLILDANGDNRGTDYVNLYPNCVKVSLFDFVKVDEHGFILNYFDPNDNTISIPYTNTDEQTMCPGLQIAFQDEDGHLYTKKDIKDKFNVNLDLTVALKYCKFTQLKLTPKTSDDIILDKYDSTYIALPDELVNEIIISPERGTEYSDMPTATIQLEREDPDLANVYVELFFGAESDGMRINWFDETYDYLVSPLDYFGNATLEITPKTYTVDLDVEDIKWSIADGNLTHYKYDRGITNHLNSSDRLATIDGSAKDLLQENGINLESLLAGKPNSMEFLEQKGYGWDVALDANGWMMRLYTCPSLYYDGSKLELSFCCFDWDKTYKFNIVYASATTKVIFRGSVKTVDRDREPIIVNLPNGYGSSSIDNITNALWAEAKKKEYIAEMFTSASAFADFFFNGKVNGMSIGSPASTGDGVKPGYVYYEDGEPVVHNAKFEPDYSKITFRFGAYRTHTDVSYVGAKACYGQEAMFRKQLTYDGPLYNLKHNSYYVSTDANGNYFTQIQPMYTPDSGQRISGFDLKKMDLNQAFYFVDENGKMIDDPKYLGLKVEFEFKEEPEDAYKISINANNLLYYHGYDKTVSITAKAYLNGERIPTSFDKGGPYETFYVKQFNPIEPIEVGDLRVTVDMARNYSVDVSHCIVLKDNRGFDLLDIDGAWVKGSPMGDDFAYKVSPKTVYSLDYIQVRFICEDDEMKYKFSYTPDYTLNFDLTSEMSLTKSVVVYYYILVSSPWDRYADLSDCSSKEELDNLLSTHNIARGTVTFSPASN